MFGKNFSYIMLIYKLGPTPKITRKIIGLESNCKMNIECNKIAHRVSKQANLRKNSIFLKLEKTSKVMPKTFDLSSKNDSTLN